MSIFVFKVSFSPVTALNFGNKQKPTRSVDAYVTCVEFFDFKTSYYYSFVMIYHLSTNLCTAELVNFQDTCGGRSIRDFESVNLRVAAVHVRGIIGIRRSV